LRPVGIKFRPFANSVQDTKSHFTHEPKGVTMKLWEPKRKCREAVPTHLPNHVARSRTLKCSVKSYVTDPQPKCHFNEFLFMQVLTLDKIKWINDSEHSECHGLPVLCWAYLQKVVFENSPKWPWNMIHSIPHRNPCRLYIHLAFTYSVGPSSVVCVKRTWTGTAFSTNESAWSVMDTGSQPCVWKNPKYHNWWSQIGKKKIWNNWGHYVCQIGMNLAPHSVLLVHKSEDPHSSYCTLTPWPLLTLPCTPYERTQAVGKGNVWFENQTHESIDA
jgi:hypothetical protein